MSDELGAAPDEPQQAVAPIGAEVAVAQEEVSEPPADAATLTLTEPVEEPVPGLVVDEQQWANSRGESLWRCDQCRPPRALPPHVGQPRCPGFPTHEPVWAGIAPE